MTHLPGAGTLALMLGIVVAMAVVTARLRIPYTVGLVLAGLIIGLIPHQHHIELTPGLVLFVFLPPLLFDGGWNGDTKQFARNWAPITLLATLGVLMMIALSYVFLVFGAHLVPQTAVIFGAAVAATDPVAVLALFKALRIDPGLLSIVEGESLFNDGTSVVAFSAIVSVITAEGPGLQPHHVLWTFILMTAGGIAVGAVAGYLSRLVIRLIATQVMVVAVLTVAVAYGSYFIADELGVSGIMAVIFAAIVISGSTSLANLPQADRDTIGNFWSVVAFLANTVLFVLIGASIDLREIEFGWRDAVWAIVAVILGRVLVVRGLAPVSGWMGRPLSRTWQNAIALAGMRGALSMALVLSLPDTFPDKPLLISMVFSVVLFTVVIQGALLEPLLRMMGLIAAIGGARPATA
ncbi:MAG: sodium:proton antiporter [Candidatus Eremiobacteraeota bacterium]|nr:sodium:proton antiporter [Candidatus Eremiobacteraeota bacterium]